MALDIGFEARLLAAAMLLFAAVLIVPLGQMWRELRATERRRREVRRRIGEEMERWR